MDVEDYYILVAALEKNTAFLRENLHKLKHTRADLLLQQKLGRHISEAERALKGARQECEQLLFGDKDKMLQQLRAEREPQ